jgi:hypothetical protein
MSALPAAVSPFPSDALEINRSGRLSDAQRKGLSGLARADRKNEFTFSFVFAALGVLILFGADSSKPPLLHYGFPALCLLAVVFLLYRSTSAGDALTRDLHGGKVEAVEGAISKWTISSSGGSSLSSYYVEVQNHRFDIGRAAYEAAPEAGIVRVFYLPQSKRVVNMEHLPDRPLAPGALEAPMDTLRQAFQGMRSHDHVQAAEARATMAALGNAEKAVFAPTSAAPPTAGDRDPRPLAEAILGTWQLGPMKVTFQGDGTAALVLPTGMARQGHWSVDPSGRLHLDALGGQDEATDAWVVGDSLTVSMGGQGMTAHRVAS